MNKKKSKALAFLLAASLIVPTVEGTVLAATSEEIREDIEVTQGESTEDTNDVEVSDESGIFPSEKGDKEDPYIINNVEQFKEFRDSVNNGTTYEGKYIKLDANIDLEGEVWEPIGTSKNEFKGNFDGGNKVISNLNIQNPLSIGVGLFGYASEGTIKNVILDNVTIRSQRYAGALVGKAFKMKEISNVIVKGNIIIDGDINLNAKESILEKLSNHIGGLVGYGYVDVIKNCNVLGNEGSYIKVLFESVGGLIGYSGEGDYKIDSCTVKNLDIYSPSRAGGIIGNINYGNTISNCKVEDTNIIKSSKNKPETFGTIAGANQACEDGNIKILDCSADNTYVYIKDGEEPLTQKVSMFNHKGKPVEKKVIVGNNVKYDEKEVVYGGEFEILTSDMYDSESLKLGDIGNDKYILVPKDIVAIVGEKTYSSLSEAITNCVQNGTVKLVDTVELDSTLNINGKNSITIDFNKQEVKASANFNGGSLINIEDSKDISLHNGNFVIGDKAGKAIELNNSSASMNGDFNTTTDGQNKATTIEVNDGSDLNRDNLSSINGKDKNNLDKNDIIENGGGGGNSTPSYPSKPSKPVYTHKEIIGSDRYDTAAKIADKLGSYDNVVLVNATSTMSDGLSASGLAGKENGAILLTKKDSIPKVTMDRIKRVKKVYIIGGESAINAKVANEITAAGVKVERLGGKTRVETSEIVAKKLGNYNKAFVVNGFKGEADAMSASAVAAKNGAPILLTNGKISTHAKKSGVEYYVIGGNNVVDKSIATKYDAEVLAGSDRYATNREVINEFYSGRDKVYIANGDKLVDALTASPLAKKDGIVLVNKKSDKSILKGKDTVQVGGMDFKIEFEK